MKGICGSCARLLNRREYNLKEIELEDIPRPMKLKPFIPHEKQATFDGMLLEESAVWIDAVSDKRKTLLCKDCYKELQEDTADPPQFSLANNLWIGPIPVELQILTLPESLLIGHVFPRAFVCKLWPKDRKGGSLDTLQSCLRGNVTSFEMNVDAVNQMVKGNLMPRPLAILPHLISITFISKRKLPKGWIKRTFRVRRAAIANALRCLKEINPTHYGDIEISEDRLSSVPEDDVPAELLAGVLHEEDEDILDVENDNYVPEDPPEEAEETEETEQVPESDPGEWYETETWTS